MAKKACVKKNSPKKTKNLGLTTEQYKDLARMFGHMEWEGGLQGLVDSCGVPEEVFGTHLHKPFEEFVKSYQKLERLLEETRNKIPSKLFEESEDE